MEKEQFCQKDTSNLEKRPIKERSRSEHGRRTSSAQGTVRHPATPLTQGIMGLRFPFPVSELSSPVHGPVSLMWRGKHG